MENIPENISDYINSVSTVKFLNLPEEILRIIAVFVNYRDLMNLCMGSKRLKEKICDNNNFWKDKTYHDFEGLYDIDEDTMDWKNLYKDFRRKRTLEFIDFSHLRPIPRKGILHDERAEIILEDDIKRGILDLEFRDTNGKPLLIEIVESSSLYILRKLLELGINPNVKDFEGESPLSRAIKNNKISFVKLLLEYGADPDIKDEDNETPLIWASYFNYYPIVEMLLENGADINIQTDFGTTALIGAASKGHLEIVKLLLEYGADVHIRDDWGRMGVGKGRTALDWAEAKGYKEITNLLLEYGSGTILRRMYWGLQEFPNEYGGM